MTTDIYTFYKMYNQHDVGYHHLKKRLLSALYDIHLYPFILLHAPAQFHEY